MATNQHWPALASTNQNISAARKEPPPPPRVVLGRPTRLVWWIQVQLVCCSEFVQCLMAAKHKGLAELTA